MKKRIYEVGDLVQVFEDVYSQKRVEGVGKIVKIHKQDDEILECDVQFEDDPFENAKSVFCYRRQIKI